LQMPNVDVRRVFDYVRDDVLKATHREQQPFTYGSLPPVDMWRESSIAWVSAISTSSSRDRGWRVHRGFGRSHRQLRRRRPRRLWSPLHLEPGSAGTAAAGPLNHYDRSTFYGGDARGYTDYPATEATVAA